MIFWWFVCGRTTVLEGARALCFLANSRLFCARVSGGRVGERGLASPFRHKRRRSGEGEPEGFLVDGERSTMK